MSSGAEPEPLISSQTTPLLSSSTDPEVKKLMSTVFALGVTLSPLARSAAADAPQIGPFGIDLTAMDTSVKPGDDFYRYVNGNWLKNEKIPADRPSWSSFAQLAEKSQKQVQDLIETAAKAHPPVGSIDQKIGDYYATFLDADAIERQGLTPAKRGLDAIAHLQTHTEVAALIAMPGMPLDGPISWSITLDQKNPDRYIVGVGQSGLSLPDREYYLKTDPEFVEIRAKFKAHIAKMLALAGHSDAEREAGEILAVETEIAKRSWELEKRRDRDATYNLRTVAALETEIPDYPWRAGFKASDLGGIHEVVVVENSAMAPLATLFKATPVSTWRTYLTYQFLTHEASVLPKAFDQENFDFYGRILNGQPQQRERWKRAVQATNVALGEAVGQLYVAKYFPPEAKAAAEALVENLRRAYAKHLSNVPWMTEDTKKVALEKLAAFRPKIGYPNKWRDYSALEVKRDDAFGNLERSQIFEWRREVARLNKPTDRDEWAMTPQQVNAYYNPIFNEVVFPAAILQAPFFDPKADPAVNYGAIGGVIGHEMGHGFDDQGAKSDAKGILRTWWKSEDVEAFKKRTEALAAQYDVYEPIKGLHINGHLTLGENLGDLGGMTVAHDAYLLSLDGANPSVLEGFTGDQRFFLGWAQAFRSLEREEALRNQILSDVHSPPEFRVNGVVRNVDAWYQAFDVKAADKLYLPPGQRVHVW
jgi:putative endopeptidase